MRRHPFDLLSFVFGAIFIATAALVAFDADALSVDALRWGAVLFLMAVGGVLLVTARPRGGHGNGDERS